MKDYRPGRTLSRRDFLKATIATAASVATAATLGGCGAPATPSAPATQTSQEFYFLGGTTSYPDWEKDQERAMNEWAKAQGLKMKVERLGGADIWPRMAAIIQTKTGPDVVMIQANMAWLYPDSLLDLGDVADEAGKVVGGYYPHMVEVTKVKDVWRAVPYYMWASAFNYRSDHFSAAGAKVPKTWDEFIEEGKKLKKYGKPFGQSMGHSNVDPYSFWYPWLWSHGGKEVEADGKTVAINSKETLNAVERAVVLFNEVWVPGVLSWDDASNNRAFQAGALSCTLNAGTILTALKKDQPEIAKVLETFTYPSGPAGQFGYFGTASLVVPAFAKNPRLCKDFIKTVVNAENMTKAVNMMQGYAQGPGPKGTEDNPIWQQEPKMKAFLDVVTSKIGHWPGLAGPPSQASSDAMSRFIIIDLFAKACSGEFKPQEAVNWAETQLKNIYK